MMNHTRTLGRGATRAAALSLILALAILAAALPQTAQAAVTCRTFHVVREGDTKPFIAHTYDLSWREIAKANGINSADKLKVGDRLCIPEGEKETPATPEGSKNAKITATVVGNTIRLHVDDFSSQHSYQVKARAPKEGIGGWTKLGRIVIDKNDAQDFSFSLPSGLRNAANISVCLKDITTDELICRTAVNPSAQ